MNPGQTWQSLATGYPGVDPCTMAAFDVLAPVNASLAERIPIYELPHETTPTPDEVWALADQLVSAVARAVP
jgi:hypothetical protein